MKLLAFIIQSLFAQHQQAQMDDTIQSFTRWQRVVTGLAVIPYARPILSGVGKIIVSPLKWVASAFKGPGQGATEALVIGEGIRIQAEMALAISYLAPLVELSQILAGLSIFLKGYVLVASVCSFLRLNWSGNSEVMTRQTPIAGLNLTKRGLVGFLPIPFQKGKKLSLRFRWWVLLLIPILGGLAFISTNALGLSGYLILWGFKPSDVKEYFLEDRHGFMLVFNKLVQGEPLEDFPISDRPTAGPSHASYTFPTTNNQVFEHGRPFTSFLGSPQENLQRPSVQQLVTQFAQDTEQAGPGASAGGPDGPAGPTASLERAPRRNRRRLFGLLRSKKIYPSLNE